MEENNLLIKTIQAAKSTSLITATKVLVQFLVQLILLRILIPEIFGTFTFAQMIVGFFALSATIQGKRAIIKQREKVKETVDVCFSFELALGLLIMTIIIITAPLVSQFLRKPEIVKYMQVLALTLLFTSFIYSPRAIFERKLEFHRANISTFFGVVANAIISISMALTGFGIWSLIVGLISGQVIEFFILWKMLPYKPHLFIKKEILSDVLKFGFPISLSAVVAFMYSNIDKFMIGKMLGDLHLGYYWFAVSLPHNLLAAQNSIGTVIYPAFANVEDDIQLKSGFSRATKISAIIFFLPCAIVLVLGEPTIKFIFGEKWLPALFPFQIFMLLVAIRGVVISHWSPLYMIRGKSINILYISLFYLISIVTFGYLVIPRYGISGMAVVVLLTILCSIPISKFTLRSILKFSYLRILWPQIIMFFLSLGVCLILANVAKNSFVLFLFSLFLILVLYIASLFIVDRDMFLWCKKISIYLLKH